jgi:hypothetical protein
LKGLRTPFKRPSSGASTPLSDRSFQSQAVHFRHICRPFQAYQPSISGTSAVHLRHVRATVEVPDRACKHPQPQLVQQLRRPPDRIVGAVAGSARLIAATAITPVQRLAGRYRHARQVRCFSPTPECALRAVRGSPGFNATRHDALDVVADE